jgi:hypothetical protein
MNSQESIGMIRGIKGFFARVLRFGYFSSKLNYVEQWILLKFLFVKRLRYKVAHVEPRLAPGTQAYSLWQMRSWIDCFVEGDFSWQDDHRSGRRLSELSGGICGYLDKHPLISVKKLAKHFSRFMLTISRILTAHLGRRKFSRTWAPHDLTDDQEQLRSEISERLLNVLTNDEFAAFPQVTTGDESSFSCHY